jgi:uncharacterized protein (DUF2147 family)
MRQSLFISLLLIALSVPGFSQSGADAILGKWLTGTGKAQIEIYKTNNKYNGKIVWIKNPNTPEGKPKLDIKNPEASLQSRQLLGLVNLTNFDYDKDGQYENGKIYDPESGKTYSCEMTLKGNDNLNVRGYIGFSFIGRTDSWTRVK